MVLFPVRLGPQLGPGWAVNACKNSNFSDPKVGVHPEVRTESELGPESDWKKDHLIPPLAAKACSGREWQL